MSCKDRNGIMRAWYVVVMTAGLLLVGGCQGTHVVRSTEKFPPATGFIRTQVTVDEQPRTVWVFIPKTYSPEKRYPAILFLHGLFEKGNGGDKVLSAGLGPVIAQDPERWPFITIFPQSPGNWRGDEKERIAMSALDSVQAHWAVDPDRVILAGLSYGGLGTWEIGAKHPDRFAALVPVSGLSAEGVAERLRSIPIWAFTSKNDPWVKSENSVQMCEGIDAIGGRARLTEFEGRGHDCWAMAVANSDLVSWMLQQRRQSTPSRQTTANARALALPPLLRTE